MSLISMDEDRLREIIREEMLAVKSELKLFTPEQASVLLGIKITTLANWRSIGKGPKYTKFGELVRYKLEDLKDHIEAHTRS